MALIYLAIIIARLPLRIGGYLLKRPRFLIIAVVLIVGLVAYSSYQGRNNVSVQAEPYQTSPPTKDKATFVVSTPSRLYYAAEYYVKGDDYILTDFYDYDRKDWVRHTQPLQLGKENARIYTR